MKCCTGIMHHMDHYTYIDLVYSEESHYHFTYTDDQKDLFLLLGMIHMKMTVLVLILLPGTVIRLSSVEVNLSAVEVFDKLFIFQLVFTPEHSAFD